MPTWLAIVMWLKPRHVSEIENQDKPYIIYRAWQKISRIFNINIRRKIIQIIQNVFLVNKNTRNIVLYYTNVLKIYHLSCALYYPYITIYIIRCRYPRTVTSHIANTFTGSCTLCFFSSDNTFKHCLKILIFF